MKQFTLSGHGVLLSDNQDYPAKRIEFTGDKSSCWSQGTSVQKNFLNGCPL